MSRTYRRRNRRGDFDVIARGVRRQDADHSAIMRATLDHYLASREKAAEEQAARRHRKEPGNGRA